MIIRYFTILFFLSFHLNAQDRTVGLLEYSEEAMPGYTLIAPLSSTQTYLIDNCGDVVNEWEANNPPGAVTYLLESGSLLRTGRSQGNFNGGGVGGLLEIYNWDGSLEWGSTFATPQYHQHHDVEYMPNGNILLIAWEAKTSQEAILMGFQGNLSSQGIWPDMILEIEPIGNDDFEIVWEWHAWDHMVQDINPTFLNFGVVADHPELIDINVTATPGLGSNPDWIHLNAIDYNEALDQIVVSSRHLNEIWIIDHSTTTEEAAGHTGGRYGKGGDLLYRWGNPMNYDRGTTDDQVLFGQHDANWVETGIDEGKIMIFNNGGARNFSSVDIINPPIDVNGNYSIEQDAPFGPENLDWTYSPISGGEEFFASRISGAGRLENGNTLICNGQEGEVFEVSPNNKTVWRYQNPVRTFPVEQGSIPNGHSLFRAYRYGVDYPAFEGRDLIPGDPIELSPLDDDCNLLSSVNDLASSDIGIFPNPTSDFLEISTKFDNDLTIALFDLTGRKLVQQTRTNHLDLSHLENGIYIIHILKNGDLILSDKVLKI